MQDKSVRQMITEIQRQLQPISELSLTLVTQAELQTYTEDMYNRLVQVAYEGISFFNELRAGDVITAEWIEKRDEIVGRAQRLILDAPNAKE